MAKPRNSDAFIIPDNAVSIETSVARKAYNYKEDPFSPTARHHYGPDHALPDLPSPGVPVSSWNITRTHMQKIAKIHREKTTRNTNRFEIRDRLIKAAFPAIIRIRARICILGNDIFISFTQKMVAVNHVTIVASRKITERNLSEGKAYTLQYSQHSDR